MNDIMMRVRAYENGVWLAFIHPKRTLIIDPRGKIIAQSQGEQDQIVTATIGHASVSQASAANTAVIAAEIRMNLRPSGWIGGQPHLAVAPGRLLARVSAEPVDDCDALGTASLGVSVMASFWANLLLCRHPRAAHRAAQPPTWHRP